MLTVHDEAPNGEVVEEPFDGLRPSSGCLVTNPTPSQIRLGDEGDLGTRDDEPVADRGLDDFETALGEGDR